MTFNPYTIEGRYILFGDSVTLDTSKKCKTQTVVDLLNTAYTLGIENRRDEEKIETMQLTSEFKANARIEVQLESLRKLLCLETRLEVLQRAVGLLTLVKRHAKDDESVEFIGKRNVKVVLLD